MPTQKVSGFTSESVAALRRNGWPASVGMPGRNRPEYAQAPYSEFIPIEIDIKPGSDPNSINIKSKGRIPVAVLSTSSFDAASVDTDTVRFGRTGSEAQAVHSALEDIDADGDLDLILHFKIPETGIQCNEQVAYLTGRTLIGTEIEGSDSVKTTGCKLK